MAPKKSLSDKRMDSKSPKSGKSTPVSTLKQKKKPMVKDNTEQLGKRRPTINEETQNNEKDKNEACGTVSIISVLTETDKTTG